VGVGVAGGAFLNVRFICLGGVGGGRRYAGELEILNYRWSRLVKNFQLPGIPPPPTHSTKTDEPHIQKCRKYRCATVPPLCHPRLAAPHRAAQAPIFIEKPSHLTNVCSRYYITPTKLGGTTPSHIYSTVAASWRCILHHQTATAWCKILHREVTVRRSKIHHQLAPCLFWELHSAYKTKWYGATPKINLAPVGGVSYNAEWRLRSVRSYRTSQCHCLAV